VPSCRRGWTVRRGQDRTTAQGGAAATRNGPPSVQRPRGPQVSSRAAARLLTTLALRGTSLFSRAVAPSLLGPGLVRVVAELPGRPLRRRAQGAAGAEGCIPRPDQVFLEVRDSLRLSGARGPDPLALSLGPGAQSAGPGGPGAAPPAPAL
jgi:hypothetical protein